jgi:hypothetical protein
MGRDVWELMHAGDWACANGDDEGLARIAVTLARSVAGRLRRAALAVARAAPNDLDDATRRWSDLTDVLRAECAHHDVG